jgi:hypothetical protein
MTRKRLLLAATAAVALGVAGAGTAAAQGYGQPGCPYHYGQGGIGQPMPMHPGMMGMGQQQMPMHPGMGMGQQAMPMQPGMMGPGMGMGQQMHPGMGMGQGQMMMGQGPIAPGMRILPRMDLSADDVREFLTDVLARSGNPRLQVGEVERVDDDTVRADIVTADGSLVERLNVDRHYGWISRAN